MKITITATVERLTVGELRKAMEGVPEGTQVWIGKGTECAYPAISASYGQMTMDYCEDGKTLHIEGSE